MVLIEGRIGSARLNAMSLRIYKYSGYMTEFLRGA